MLELKDSGSRKAVEYLAGECVRQGRLDEDRVWVLVNLPRRSSVTLYLGPDEVLAQAIYEAARRTVAETLEYLLASFAETTAVSQ